MSVNVPVKGWLGRTRPQNKRRRIELGVNAVQRFDGAGQNIRVLSGLAWITVNGQDFTLKPGHMLQLPPGQHPVVISSLENRPVVYEIRR